jgi:hypothetical protein
LDQGFGSGTLADLPKPSVHTHRAMASGDRPVTQAVLEKILENFDADREDVRRNEIGILLSVNAGFA